MEFDLEGKILRCVLRGEKLNLVFFTSRFVKADTPEEAELKAIEMIRLDESLKASTIRGREFTPMIYLDAIWEEKWWKKTGGQGYFFFLWSLTGQTHYDKYSSKLKLLNSKNRGLRPPSRTSVIFLEIEAVLKFFKEHSRFRNQLFQTVRAF